MELISIMIAIVVPVALFAAFKGIQNHYKRKEVKQKKQYPAASKPKRGEIKKVIVLDEFEQSITQ